MTGFTFRQIPVVATIVVLAAVATMVALGFWQLDRLGEKEAMIARYAEAGEQPAIAWPTPAQYERALFRRSTVNCERVDGFDSIAGTSRSGRKGWAQIARCTLDTGASANVALGWSRDPFPPAWEGGTVTGLVTSYGESVRLVAIEPVAGLELLAAPDPSDLPNNHLAYAGQWFLFALTALVIYGLVLRQRLGFTTGRRSDGASRR
jgi:surfeit locus 1 family protein